MKTLCLILGVAMLLFTANAGAADCPDQDVSLPGLTPYQSENVYRGERANGCDCPAMSDGSMYCSSECVTGGSIDTPG